MVREKTTIAHVDGVNNGIVVQGNYAGTTIYEGPGAGGNATASAVAATIGSGHQFKSGREFAAWLGLTPRNHSSGGKERLGRITKMGDRYLRQLIVVGMTSRVRQVTNHPERADPWLTQLLQRKPARLATVAMANKTARIMWAVLTRNEPYRPHTA